MEEEILEELKGAIAVALMLEPRLRQLLRATAELLPLDDHPEDLDLIDVALMYRATRGTWPWCTRDIEGKLPHDFSHLEGILPTF